MAYAYVGFWFAICLALYNCKNIAVKVQSGINLQDVTVRMSFGVSEDGTNGKGLNEYLVLKSGATVDVKQSNFDMDKESVIECAGKDYRQIIDSSSVALKSKSSLKVSVYSAGHDFCTANFTSLGLNINNNNFDESTDFSSSGRMIFQHSVLRMDAAQVDIGNSSVFILESSNFDSQKSSLTVGNEAHFDILHNSKFMSSHSDVCIGGTPVLCKIVENSKVNLNYSTIYLSNSSHVFLHECSLTMVNSRLKSSSKVDIVDSMVTLTNSSIVIDSTKTSVGLSLQSSEWMLENSMVELMDKTQVDFLPGSKLIAKNLRLTIGMGSELIISGPITTDLPINASAKFNVGKGSKVLLGWHGSCQIFGDVDIPPGSKVFEGYGKNFVCKY